VDAVRAIPDVFHFCEAYTEQGVATVVAAQFVNLMTSADVLMGTLLINNVVFRLAAT
jgi:hypothetical protein